MDLAAAKASEARFEAYIANLARVMGHKDREEPLQDYSRGLFMAPGRKSVEPLAAITAPALSPQEPVVCPHLTAACCSSRP